MRTMWFANNPAIVASAGVGGRMEGTSPVSRYFDVTFADDKWGEDSFELCERKMFLTAVKTALKKADMGTAELDVLLGGDLLNQIISASYAAREIGSGFLGLYGACSTMAESLMLAAALVNAGYVETAAAATSSHFATAERQFRNPLELGTPKTPTSQITATAAGCAILKPSGGAEAPRATCATIGRAIDYEITDANNMGAAMMPAALETIATHLEETGRHEEYYDLIVTGDLGILGSELLKKHCGEFELKLQKHIDCGAELYKGKRDIFCGASGCGCSALMLCGYLLSRMAAGEIQRLLFVATGALMSPTSSLQGESIPAVAHAVAIEMGGV